MLLPVTLMMTGFLFPGDRLALLTRGKERKHTLGIYDVRRKDTEAKLSLHLEPFPAEIEGEVISAAFSSDGIYLALGRNDNCTHVYDSRQLTRLLFDYKHTGPSRTNPGNESYGVVKVQWVDKSVANQFGLITGGNDEVLLSSLDPRKSLVSQLSPGGFSLPNAPIWQDSSTTQECRDLEQAIGGAQELADITGSRAYERFTGNQIAKIRRLQPDVYTSTSRISLVSSFIPSIFCGRIVPVDISDASGMNIMDVVTCKWNDALLEACGGSELRLKLGPEPQIGGISLGTVSNWWVERYGLDPDCIVAPFTGDNPASVVALSAPGDAVLSLGTSTTFLLSIPGGDTPPKRLTTSHLLSHPTDFDGKIAMLCYKNGALAREQVRDRYADRSWDRFNELVEASPLGNNENFGLYFPLPEIIPPGVVGQYAFHAQKDITPTMVDDLPVSAHPRAILESQFLSIRSRIAEILPHNSPPLQRLVVTGGSSANQTIRQIAADIFGMKVYVSSTKEAAGMGGALLAKYSWWKTLRGGKGSLEEMTGGDATQLGLQCVAEPRKEVTAVYGELVDVYRACEEQVISQTV
ncbi:hypothetical protein DXG03_009417 [Asterophora parasitica]|uniref:Xylulose kinase n=1 Tax=Asterophora parasitica TaxID=117018 RepID=A0A9P7GI27_9AGAR|nr:hypothetical protein DXG03_009417 [Asterophora parasitica]